MLKGSLNRSPCHWQVRVSLSLSLPWLHFPSGFHLLHGRVNVAISKCPICCFFWLMFFRSLNERARNKPRKKIPSKCIGSLFIISHWMLRRHEQGYNTARTWGKLKADRWSYITLSSALPFAYGIGLLSYVCVFPSKSCHSKLIKGVREVRQSCLICMSRYSGESPASRRSQGLEISSPFPLKQAVVFGRRGNRKIAYVRYT